MQINRFGYYWLDTWVMANVIQLATQDFCARNLNHINDPCGRQYDQMIQKKPKCASRMWLVQVWQN